MTETKSLVEIQKEVGRELANKQTFELLLKTTFKGLAPAAMPQAIMEGMIRGYDFKDFLEKNIYAIPFRDGYSLITSIDHARKIGMRSGVVGKSAPQYQVEKDGKIVSCQITVKRRAGKDVGEFTALVFFDEYTTGRNLWTTKPRTMIAKVAEMHALRMACPEELSQAYVEEEMQSEIKVVLAKPDASAYKKKLEEVKSLEELKEAWAGLPGEIKAELEPLKDELKKKFEPKNEGDKV